MELIPKFAEQVERLPAKLRALFDAELAAGNDMYSLEKGMGSDRGKVAIILNHPFRTKPADAPAGVLYREFTDRDPMVFEFYIEGEGDNFSLITAKFKPMVLEKLGPGPPNPTEAHIAHMQERAREEEQRFAQQAAAAREAPKVAKPHFSDSASKFIASMTMTFDMWHDGTGYDLETLRTLTPQEMESIEQVLIDRHPRDWRDIESLAVIGSPRAKKEIEAALKSANPQVRREAQRYAEEKIDAGDREALLVKSLQGDNLYGGLSQAIDEAAEFHPPAVVDTLFRGALNRDGQAAVHFAALLYFLHGKSKEPFDWAHRPFFLRFNTSDREERKTAFRELCGTVGVDVAKYLR